MKESPPTKPAALVYVRVAPEPDSEPCAGCVTMTNVSGSASTSLPDKVTFVGWPEMADAVTAFATGMSLTAVTVMDTGATDDVTGRR